MAYPGPESQKLATKKRRRRKEKKVVLVARA
jgi:hypothetical protein